MRTLNQESLATSSDSAPMVMGGGVSHDEELSLAAILRTLAMRKMVILCTALAVFGAVTLYTYSKTPVYESVARLQIDPDRSSDLGLDQMLNDKLGTGDGNNKLKTEVNLIQSDTVAMRVISALKLAKNPAFAGKNLAKTITTTDPMAMTNGEREFLIGRLQGGLKVRVLTETEIVEIRFRSTDPKLATDIINSLVDQYMQRNLQTHYEGTVQVSNWLSGQMQDLQGKATESQKKLADFQKEFNILPTGDDESDNVVIDKLKILNQQLSDAEADRIVKEARHRLAQTGNPELIASVVPSTSLQIYRSQEADLKAQLAQLTAKFGSGYPKVSELQAQLVKLDAATSAEILNVGKRLEDEYLSAAKTEDLLRNQFNQQKTEAYQLNEHTIQYAVLKHEVENSRELYDALQLKLRMAGITAGLSSSYIDIVDRAAVPASPVLPNRSLNMMLGAIGGLLVGLVAAFGVESFDDTLSSSEMVESLTNVPVLCSIPYNQPRYRAKAVPGEIEKAVPVSPMLINLPRSQASEAFRGLRSSIMLSSADVQPKMIAVVSSVAGEGKSTLSANIAVSFAQNGESVLLIDADLRRSSLHSQFGIPSSPIGLSTVLTQGMSDGALLTPVESLPNLTLLPAGPHPPNPAELLGSKRMREVLEEFYAKYDRIIIDTPPVLTVSDSLALANVADAVVLVVRSGTARKKAILRTRELLRRANSNVIGIIFNCVDPRVEHYYYAYGATYRKQMGKYFDDEKDGYKED
jgi:capsular exopolysaccharide synthesis family protein